ncbi:MAG: Ig-like domain-containing protein [Limisphaerales bacterium]
MARHSQVPFRCQTASAFVLSLIWLSALPAVAQTTRTWTGSESSDWSDGNNWSPAGVPGSGDTAIISGGSVILTNDVLVNNFALSGGTLGITNGSLTTVTNATLSGGTVSGGCLVATNGASLVVQSGTLDGVTVNGVLDVGNSYSYADLTVTNGLVLNGTALLGSPPNSYGGGIRFAGSQALEGEGTVVFADSGAGNALWLAIGGTTLVIGPGITVRGQSGTIGCSSLYGAPQDVSVVNQGAISADVNGGTIAINAQPLVNSGTLAMTNGGSLSVNYLPSLVGLSVSGNGTLTLDGTWRNDLTLSVSGTGLAFSGSWTNAGTIDVSGGTLTLNGSWINAGTINVSGGTLTLNGSWTNTGAIDATNSTVYTSGTSTVDMLSAIGGTNLTLYLNGTLANTDTTLVLDGNLGVWALQGGTIQGGTVTTTNGAALIVNESGTLDGVTVAGVLDVGNTYNGANLTVTNGLVLNGTALVGSPTHGSWAGISFAGSQTLSGNGTVVFGQIPTGGGGLGYGNALYLAHGGTTLTIGPGITVRGQAGAIGAAAYAWNGPANVALINQGTIAADVSSGTITINAQPFTNDGLAEALNGGTLDVYGTFDNNGFIGASGTVNLPSPSGGVTLTFGPPPAYFFGPGLIRLTQPAISAQPQGLVAGNGGTAAFSVTATGSALAYQWQLDGTNLAGATNSTLSFGNVNNTLAGSYSVVVTNLLGSTNSAAATLTVLGTGVTPANINSTWIAANSPYVVGTHFTVSNLVIEPGVSVLFNGGCGLTVTGLLQAVGTSNNPITFAGASPGAGWQGIRFVSADTNSAMGWCVVRGAAAGGIRFTNTPFALGNCIVDSNAGVSGGGIYTDSPLLLQNCSLVNNAAVCGQQSSPYFVQGGGLFVAGGNVTLQSCVISNNTALMPNIGVTNETSTGGGIDCEAGTLTLSNCTVVSNLAVGAGSSSTEAGGGVYLNSAAATLGASGSVFQGNGAPGGFGGAVAMGNGALNNCVFSSNAATFGGALWIGGNGQTKAANCLMAGNSASLGGAVYSSVATVAGDFENCTIARNSPDGFNGYTGVIHDSIVYSNGNEIVLGLVAGPVVSYCDVQGGFSGPGTNNLDVDPQFANTANFELSETSPLIDAGDPAPQFNDQAFPPSQGFDQNDLGAYGGPGAGYWPAFAALLPVVMVNGQAAAPFQAFAVPNSSPPTISFGNGFPGGTFQYTLDGSNPLEFPAYEGAPFVLTNSAQIRVIAFSADFLSYAIGPPVMVDVLPTYGVTAGAAGGGGVTPPTSGFLSNAVATLTATNAPGWTFLHWAGDAAGTNNPLALAVNRSLNVQAVFGTPIVVSVVGNGSVQSNPALALYPYGSTAQLAAVPGNTNTYFRVWSGAGGNNTNSPLNFVVTNASPVVGALFGGLPAGERTLNLLVNGAGTVSRNPQASYYVAGSVVTISAAPAAGNIFTGWSGGITGADAPTNVTLNSSLTITANFISTNAPPPQPPIVAITSPLDGAVFTAGSSIALAASASDTNAGGTVVQVAFFAGTNQIALLTNSPFSFAWTNAPVGTNVLEAEAVNNFGLSTVSAPVNVVVNPPPPGPAVFSLSSAVYSVLENGGSVTITVQKSLNSTNGTVEYTTANGSALAVTAGQPVGNYRAVAGSLTFAAGQTSTNVSVPIIYNPVYEGNTTFSFLLSPSGDGSSVGTRGSALVTIVDVNQPSTTNSVLANIFPAPAPESDASLRVFTEPAQAGGQWKLVWEAAWHNSGDTITALPQGNYPVQFSPVAGFIAPAAATNVVLAGALTVVTNQYAVSGEVSFGSLSVDIEPSSLASSVDPSTQAQWQLQGDTNWYDSDFMLTDLVAGEHIVVFKEVAGWVTPGPRVVYVGANERNSVAVTYLVAEQSSGTPPSVLQFSDASSPAFGLPYVYNGQLLTDAGYGSGCVVQPRVVLSAAHVVFNDAALAYVQNVNWFFQEFPGDYNPPAQVPAGWYVFSGYAAARTNDNSPGVESPVSQEFDVAALYFLEDAGRGGSSGYLVSEPSGTQWLEATALKTLVGYPVDGVAAINTGRMHATTPGNVIFSQVTNEVFATTAITGYPGNSGGPLCVQYTNGNYYPAGVYLGGTANTVVRAIDGSVAELINWANVSANTGANHVGGGVVNLSSGGGGGLLEPGSFQILISPAAAIAAGAAWQIAALSASSYYSNNSAVYELPAGNYTVVFRAAAGYVTPTNATLNVVGGQAVTLNITYAAATGPTVPGLLAPAIAKGMLQFIITGSANERIAIERSTDLESWTTVITNTLGAGGSVSFSDALSTNRARAFYRAQVVP